MSVDSKPTVYAPIGRAFTEFMASGGGRLVRGGMGITLLATGFVVGPPVGYALAAFAVVPILAGVLNLCPVAPLWGGHFRGSVYCARRSSGEN